MLKKARKLAQDSDEELWIALTLMEEIKFVGHYQQLKTRKSIKRISEIEKSFDERMNGVIILGNLLSVNSQLAILFYNPKYEKSLPGKIQQLKENPAMQMSPQHMSIANAALWYNNHALIHTYLTEMDKAAVLYLKGANSLKRHPKYCERNWMGYMGILTNYIIIDSTSVPKKFYEEHFAFIENSLQIWKNKDGKGSEFERAFILYMHLRSIYMVMFFEESEFKKTYENYTRRGIIPSKQRANYQMIMLSTKLNFSVLHILTGNLSHAAQLVNEVKNTPLAKKVPYTYSCAYLVQMYLSFLKKDVHHIEYLYEKLKYHEKGFHLKSEAIVYMVPDQLMALCHARDRQEFKGLLKSFIRDFNALSPSDKYIPSFKHFNWGKWLAVLLKKQRVFTA